MSRQDRTDRRADRIPTSGREQFVRLSIVIDDAIVPVTELPFVYYYPFAPNEYFFLDADGNELVFNQGKTFVCEIWDKWADSITYE